jgi:uncharacterized membrane protein
VGDEAVGQADDRWTMSTLTATKFPTPQGADDALDKLQKLQSQQLITILDAAVVSWETGHKRPKTRELRSTTGAGALGGAFWGMLFGLIFFIPILGLAIGAAAGALMGSLTDAGISKEFIEDVRQKVTPGTSALFLLSSDAVLDRVRDEFRGSGAEIISTNLSADQEQKLHEAFDDE